MKQIHFVSNIMAYIIIYCKIKILGLPTYRLLTVNDIKIVLGRKIRDYSLVKTAKFSRLILLMAYLHSYFNLRLNWWPNVATLVFKMTIRDYFARNGHHDHQRLLCIHIFVLPVN